LDFESFPMPAAWRPLAALLATSTLALVQAGFEEEALRKKQEDAEEAYDRNAVEVARSFGRRRPA
jgi:hypothetical protein